MSNESNQHGPVEVYSVSGVPDWVFIKCACGQQPISRVWLTEHWTGDPEAGKAAVSALIAKQAAKEASA